MRKKSMNLELTVEDRLEVILELIHKNKKNPERLTSELREKLGKWQQDDFLNN